MQNKVRRREIKETDRKRGNVQRNEENEMLRRGIDGKIQIERVALSKGIWDSVFLREEEF